MSRHAEGGCHLPQAAYAQESFIHWNGPLPHNATKLLVAALNRHFGGKPWHFTKVDRGTREGSLDRVLQGKH